MRSVIFFPEECKGTIIFFLEDNKRTARSQVSSYGAKVMYCNSIYHPVPNTGHYYLTTYKIFVPNICRSTKDGTPLF
jgi:hypothetical protein